MIMSFKDTPLPHENHVGCDTDLLYPHTMLFSHSAVCRLKSLIHL